MSACAFGAHSKVSTPYPRPIDLTDSKREVLSLVVDVPVDLWEGRRDAGEGEVDDVLPDFDREMAASSKHVVYASGYCPPCLNIGTYIILSERALLRLELVAVGLRRVSPGCNFQLRQLRPDRVLVGKLVVFAVWADSVSQVDESCLMRTIVARK